MRTECDLLIVGAGPAGLAAAAEAADLGLSVLLLDEQAAPGGQIYRGITRTDPDRRRRLGKAYAAGAVLAAGAAVPGVASRPGATVWRIDEDGTVTWSEAGAARQARGACLLLATGALERPIPVPGWTLPGVMTAGAAQILLKTSGTVPRDAVLAGSGPLLYQLAVQLLDAGAPPRLLLETQGPGDLAAALPLLPGALRRPGQLVRGLGLLARLRRDGIPRATGVRGLRILGEEVARGVCWRTADGNREIACDRVLLHAGVVPNLQASRALRLEHRWDAAQRCWHPRTDAWGESSRPGLFLAGDGAGIVGAAGSALQGRLAALAAAVSLARLDVGERDRRAAPLRRALARERAARPFLDRLYAPSPEIRLPDDETVLCRCEDVSAGAVRTYAARGCLGLNQIKAFGRCGMGPCQGRFCALSVAEVLADARGVPTEAVASYRLRMPLKPVTLGELAALAPDQPHAAHQP